jgi:glycosyltransferase involved in cell wall biosynthesis
MSVGIGVATGMIRTTLFVAGGSTRKDIQKNALSVVLIARNEEANIAQCIESVLKETGWIAAEIILVDSASTDRTVEIASNYPVTILRLDADAELSPSAGRFVGGCHAHGEFILFLDADMVLMEGWLADGVAAMADGSLGAVAGRLFRVLPGEGLNLDHPDALRAGPVVTLGGAGLYRAEALGAAGGFNPFVKGEEERELGHRILAHGYKIIRTEIPMVYHRDKQRVSSEIDEKASHFQGVGQIVRAYGVSEVAREVLRQQERDIRSALIFFALMGLALYLALFSGKEATAAIVGIVGLGFFGLVLRRQLWKVPLFVRYRALLLINFIRGWLRGIPDPATYRASVSVVCQQSNLHDD